MKLQKGSLSNDVELPKWMENVKNNGQTNVQASSFVSPIWSQTSESHVVTLNLKPFRSNNLSLDTFMATHCSRRNCSDRQKFMLKPLGLDRNTSTNINKAFGKDSVKSFLSAPGSVIQPAGTNLPPRPSNKKVAASVVTIGNYTSTKQFHNIVPNGLCTFKNNAYHPSPKLSQVTGQKIPIGSAFSFNCHRPGYFNLLQQETDIVARGTPVLTVNPKHEEQLKPTQRWKSKNESTIDKACKYTDPVLGASASFQERLSEITQHELDTVKWERKKGRKKQISSS